MQSLNRKCMKVQHALYDQDSFLPPTYTTNFNCFFVGNKKEPWWARLPKEVCDMIEHIDSFYINHVFFSKHNNCSVIIFFFTYFTRISNLTAHQQLIRWLIKLYIHFMRTSFDNIAQHILSHLMNEQREKEQRILLIRTKDPTEASSVQLMSIKVLIA